LTLAVFGNKDPAESDAEQTQPPIDQSLGKSSSNADDEDDEWKDSESEDEEDGDEGSEQDKAQEDQKKWSYLTNTTLHLRHASMRDYFRNPVSKPTPLTTAIFDAQMDLAVTCMDVLCNGLKDPKFEAKLDLEEYAVSSCFNHLRNVDINSASDKQIVRVVEGLFELLTKANLVANVLERYKDQSYLGFRPASDPKSPDRDLVLKWFRRASSLGSDILRSESAAWVKEIITNPLRLLLPLARAHVVNWYDSLSPDDASCAFDCALKALITVWSNLLPLELQLTSSQTDIIAPALLKPISRSGYRRLEEIMLVSDAFPDVEKDSDSHLQIGLALTNSSCYDAALTEMNQSLALAESELDRFRTLIGLAQVYNGLNQFDRACETLNSALAIDHGKLPEELRGLVATEIKQAFITMAESRGSLGDTRGAVEAYRKAREAQTDEPTELLDEIIEILDDTKDYRGVIEEIESWKSGVRIQWLFLHPTNVEDYHTIFQRAAKYCNKEDFMVRCYNAAIKNIEHTGLSSVLRYHLAQAYRRVICNEENAYQLLQDILKDKPFLKHAEDDDIISEILIEARDLFSEMIYDRIQSSPNTADKKALVKRLGNLPSHFKQSASGGLDPGNELFTLSLAKAYIGLDLPKKAKKLLDQKFRICIEALNDTVGWNDSPSFQLLARILAFADAADLNKDAQIAFSAIFSAVDPKVSHDESDSDDDILIPGLAEAYAAIKSKESEKLPYDEDLAHRGYINCDGECPAQFLDYWSQPLYLCLTCVDVSLFEACYEKRIAQSSGRPSSHWRTYCGPNHEYIKGPIDGWGGVKEGVMTIGEVKVKFSDWLKDVEKGWDKVKL
jgi:tetratricopeptide (TPR) repeat protein